ncbi:MAG: FAD-dependent oxidoreductase, partial [Chloroflexi bacterium]|nr:FAD-dependent oxidoreductase [Chloroflexota bacterium]
HFVIDRHPQHANVAIAGGFSGHGFKFCPVIGELLADLTIDPAAAPPALFGWSRLLG